MRKLIALLLISVFFIGLLAIPNNDTSFAQDSNVVGFLVVENAGVELQRSGTSIWVGINVESVIGTGDKVRTDDSGLATITYFGGDMTMDVMSNTEVQFNELRSNEAGIQVSIEIPRGETKQVIPEDATTESTYEFVTPTMSVFVQEGSFDLVVEEDGTAGVLAQTDNVFISGTSGVVEIPEGSGTRSNADGSITSILPVDNLDQLDVALEGLNAVFNTDGDFQLNVRRGPNSDTELLGNVSPEDIRKVHGISDDGVWYRIPFGDAFGWVSSSGLSVTTNSTLLVEFDLAYLEVVQTSAAVASATTTAPAVQQNTMDENRLPSYFTEYSQEELALIAGMNEWRVSQGLLPFEPNPILTRMARQQGAYIMSFPSLPSDIHKDSKGRYPRERAISSDYNWPFYGQSSRVAVSENAYAGASVEVAINWWRNSEIHNRAATNAGYREIGVAAIPHPFGHVYITVFGARPNYFPILHNPVENVTYVPGENYEYSSGGDWMHTIQEIQTIPTALSQLDENAWQGWRNQVDLDFSQPFALALRGDSKTVVFEVDPIDNIVILPETLEMFADRVPTDEGETTDTSSEGTSTDTTNTNSAPLFPTNTPAAQ